MSTIDLDSDPVWVVDAWAETEGELRLRDALNPDNRELTAYVGVYFALTGVALGGTSLSLSFSYVYAALFAVLAGVTGVGGLFLLEELDCRLREDQECRECRKETARWGADP